MVISMSRESLALVPSGLSERSREVRPNTSGEADDDDNDDGDDDEEEEEEDDEEGEGEEVLVNP